MAISRATIILVLATVFACLSVRKANAVEDSELIRASIIEKVASFIEWPSLDQAQFNLCAFDNTPLLPALQTYYANSFFKEKPIKLVTLRTVTAISACQIIYLASSETQKLDAILRQIEDRPILIVSEKQDAVSLGVHVDFFVDDNRLRLEINRTALTKNRLKASYHLLGVARIVD